MPNGGVSGLQKAAILLLALGEELAPEVLRLMGQKEIEKVTTTMYELKAVSDEEMARVLEEFQRAASSNGAFFTSTKEYVRNVLVKAIGNEKARSMLRQLSVPQQTLARKMAFDIDPKTLARLIDEEQPQVIALILSNMEAKLASRALKEFPQALQVDIISRMAQLGEIPPDVLEDVESALRRKVEDMGLATSRGVSGMDVVAQLLNSLDRGSWSAIVEKIKEQDSGLAEAIKQRMFTFEDLVKLDDRPLQTILSSANTQSLAVALRGTSKELQQKIYKNLSRRAGEMLKDDMEAMGPVKQKDVFKAQQEILEVMRKLEDEGKIEISSGEEEVIV